MSKKDHYVATILKLKEIRINIVQAQDEEMYFIFNLEYRHATLSRGIPHGLPTKSQCSTKPKNPNEMSETQWSHTLHISLD
jgi:hypothetical protein